MPAPCSELDDHVQKNLGHTSGYRRHPAARPWEEAVPWLMLLSIASAHPTDASSVRCPDLPCGLGEYSASARLPAR